MGGTTRRTPACPMTRTASAATWVRTCQPRCPSPQLLQPWPLGLLNPCLLSGWRLFDDSTVTTVDESQVVTRYAYVLFYRRRNSPVERPLPGHPPDHRAERTPSTEAAASQVRARVSSSAFGATEPRNVPVCPCAGPASASTRGAWCSCVVVLAPRWH